MGERKEWLAVERSAKGSTVLRCTLQEGAVTSKYAIVTHGSDLKSAVAEVRKYATTNLDALIEASS